MERALSTASQGVQGKVGRALGTSPHSPHHLAPNPLWGLKPLSEPKLGAAVVP